MADLERPASRTTLAHQKKITPHILLAELVRRNLIMNGERLHSLEIKHLGPLRQTRQRHVVNHPLTQRRHLTLLSSVLMASAKADHRR